MRHSDTARESVSWLLPRYIHTSCGRLALELEELCFHLGELLLQGLHCLPVLVLQVPHLLSEAAAEDLALGHQLSHHLRILSLHCQVLRLDRTQPAGQKDPGDLGASILHTDSGFCRSLHIPLWCELPSPPHPQRARVTSWQASGQLVPTAPCVSRWMQKLG